MHLEDTTARDRILAGLQTGVDTWGNRFQQTARDLRIETGEPIILDWETGRGRSRLSLPYCATLLEVADELDARIAAAERMEWAV